MPASRSARTSLAVLLAIAFALRAWHADRMSVEHFDEGVYASNFFAGHLDNRYPSQELYAPPLLPALFEWVLVINRLIFQRATPHAVMWVNVALGTVLVAAVWWTTRELAGGVERGVEGPGTRGEGQTATDPSSSGIAGKRLVAHEAAGLAAAALVAGSDLLIQYSRSALTDIPVCLWMTLAVGAGARGMRSGRALWLGSAAVLTALAWWTKYNGWLPLAILGAGSAAWVVVGRLTASDAGSPHAGRILFRWGVVALGAGLLWLPCLWDLQPYGGYAAVAANHKGYIVGWSGWGDSLLRHLAVDRHCCGAATIAGLLLAVGLAAETIARGRSARLSGGDRGDQSYAGYLFGLFVFCPVAVLAGCEATLAVGLLLAVGLNVVIERRTRGRADLEIGLWIALAWVMGLGAATPFYRPYPRLVLPWLVGAMITASLSWALLFRNTASLLEHAGANTGGDQSAGGGGRGGLQALRDVPLRFLALGCIAGALVFLPSSKSPAWQDRRGLERGAGEMLAAIQQDLAGQPRSTVPELDCVIYVLAEPGLYYHLAAREGAPVRFIAQPAANLGMLQPGKIDARLPVYLAAGIHAPHEIAELEANAARAKPVAEISYLPSDLVLLDEYSPAEAPAHAKQSLRLWRIEP